MWKSHKLISELGHLTVYISESWIFEWQSESWYTLAILVIIVGVNTVWCVVIYTPQYHDEYTLCITDRESSSRMLYTTYMSSGRKTNAEEGNDWLCKRVGRSRELIWREGNWLWHQQLNHHRIRTSLDYLRMRSHPDQVLTIALAEVMTACSWQLDASSMSSSRGKILLLIWYFQSPFP